MGSESRRPEILTLDCIILKLFALYRSAAQTNFLKRTADHVLPLHRALRWCPRTFSMFTPLSHLQVLHSLGPAYPSSPIRPSSPCLHLMFRRMSRRCSHVFIQQALSAHCMLGTVLDREDPAGKAGRVQQPGDWSQTASGMSLKLPNQTGGRWHRTCPDKLQAWEQREGKACAQVQRFFHTEGASHWWSGCPRLAHLPEN